MALELEVEKIDAVPENLRSLYVEKDGKYRLDVTGIEDVSGLKKSHDKLLAEKKQAAAEAAAAKAAAEQAKLDAAKLSGDAAILNKSWEEKFNTSIGEKDTAIKQRDQYIFDLTVGATASRIASKLAKEGHAEALELAIRPRLTVDTSTGRPVPKVLDKTGNISALTLEDLEKEFSESKLWAPMIAAAGGSGAGYRPGGSPNGAKTIKRADFMSLSPKEQAKIIKEGIKPID